MSRAAGGDSQAPDQLVQRTGQLLHVVQQLSQAHTDEQIHDIVRHAARRLLDADGASVLRDGDRCHYVEEDAIAPLWKGQRFPMSACVSGWAMLHQRSVSIPDIYTDVRVPHDAYRRTFVRSLIMVPIRLADPIGAIGVYWAHQHQASTAEIDLVQALADTTSVAIENVRLVDDLERRVAARTLELHRLIGVVSHELRNPLAAVRGALSMAEQDDLPRTARDMVEAATRNTDRILKITNDLIDLDRLDAGMLHLHPEPVQATELVQQVVDTAKPLAHTAGVQLSITVEAHRFIADGQRIVQALVNLVSNAIKFSPRGSTVSLTARPTDRTATRFVVSDQGRGIPGDQLRRVFDRYAQVDPDTDSRISHGAGLGLAITHAIITAHGGTIEVESTTGRGTTFTIQLPTAVTRPPGRPGMREQEPGHEDTCVSRGRRRGRQPTR
jgi:signal transduction histidine kinase